MKIALILLSVFGFTAVANASCLTLRSNPRDLEPYRECHATASDCQKRLEAMQAEWARQRAQTADKFLQHMHDSDTLSCE